MHHMVNQLCHCVRLLLTEWFCRLHPCIQAVITLIFHCKTDGWILRQKAPHKNATQAFFLFWFFCTMVLAGQQFFLHLDFCGDLEMTWQLVFEKHSSVKCFHAFDCFAIQSSFPFSFLFFFSFEQRWVSSYWCEAAIDFYLEAEVKGALTRSSRLNVYWPIICDMVCIFKCVGMSWDHWRAASFSGWAEIEPRPVAVFGGFVCVSNTRFGAFVHILDFFVVWFNRPQSASNSNAKAFFSFCFLVIRR